MVTMRHDTIRYGVCSGFYQRYQWYTNIVQGSTNGTIGKTIGINGNANGTTGSPNGTIGKPMVKLLMVPLGNPEQSLGQLYPLKPIFRNVWIYILIDKMTPGLLEN